MLHSLIWRRRTPQIRACFARIFHNINALTLRYLMVKHEICVSHKDVIEGLVNDNETA